MKGERTLYNNQLKSLYTMADKLSKSGYIRGAGIVFKTLECLYHSSITANNLAAYYEEYGRSERYIKRKKRGYSVDNDVVRYYRLSNKRRRNIKATCSLGYISYRNQKYYHALGYYRRALKLKKRAELFYNVAVMYFYMGKRSQAIHYFNKAIPELKRSYQKEACLALIYIYAVSGYKELARKHFRQYIDTYDERNIDLLYVAYVCQEYGYIDQNSFAFSQEEDFTLQDAELVIRVLFMVGKEKLAHYFFYKWMEKKRETEDNQWMGQCNEVYQFIANQNREAYVPCMNVDPILHRKFYYI